MPLTLRREIPAMTQAHDGSEFATGALLQSGDVALPAPAERFTGWLVMADPDGPIDLPRLFPEVEVRVEVSSAGSPKRCRRSSPAWWC